VAQEHSLLFTDLLGLPGRTFSSCQPDRLLDRAVILTATDEGTGLRKGSRFGFASHTRKVTRA